jgi:hypothetical protein
MDITSRILIAIVVTIALIIFLWILFRKIESKNNMVTLDEASLNWKESKCPTCGKTMEGGYAFAGKGIIFSPKGKKLPGAFSTIGKALDNTFSMNITPAVNMAWHCSSCKVVVIDHAKMLKRKKA